MLLLWPTYCTFWSSVADSDPNPPDPHVFGPPGSGSGSISQRYGSESFYHYANIVRKTFISTVFWLLFDFLSLSGSISQRHGSADLDPDPLVRGMDPRIRIRIHTKMSWVRNTVLKKKFAKIRLGSGTVIPDPDPTWPKVPNNTVLLVPIFWSILFVYWYHVWGNSLLSLCSSHFPFSLSLPNLISYCFAYLCL